MMIIMVINGDSWRLRWHPNFGVFEGLRNDYFFLVVELQGVLIFEMAGRLWHSHGRSIGLGRFRSGQKPKGLAGGWFSWKKKIVVSPPKQVVLYLGVNIVQLFNCLRFLASFIFSTWDRKSQCVSFHPGKSFNPRTSSVGFGMFWAFLELVGPSHWNRQMMCGRTVGSVSSVTDGIRGCPWPSTS